jgi:uncharacterized membrane protein YbaN (DUF454 family)
MARKEAANVIERIHARREGRGYQRSNLPFAAQRLARRMKRFVLIAVAGLFALFVSAGIIGAVIDGIGFFGILAVLFAIPLVLVAAVAFSREKPVCAETIVQSSLPQLASRTRSWIDQQRLALPAPAATLADDIGRKIAALQPQLDTLAANAPEAIELRRLVGEELPQLVEGYKRVPANMRHVDRNGRVADRELIDGMRLLDDEIGDLAQAIASTDMDRLSSHKRYLELRYKGDEA